MRKIERSGVAALTALAFAACGGDDAGTEAAGAEWQGTMTDSAGVMLVENPGTGIWTSGEAWTVTEEVQIGGGFDVSEEYQFGLVAAIAVDDAGNIYVGDQQASHIKAFGPDGTYMTTLGGPGGGPGEIGLGLSGVFADGEYVSVADMGNFRVSRYAMDGEFVDSRPIDLTAGIPIRWDKHPDGRIVHQLRSSGQGESPLDDGDQVRTMEDEPTMLLQLPRGESFELAESGLPQFRIFEPEPVWDLGEDGRLAYAMNSSYRIHLYDDAGNLRRTVSLPFEEREVTEGSKNLMTRAMGGLFEQQGLPPAVVDQLLSGVSFGDTYPAFVQIIIAADGGIWVQLLRTPEEMGEQEDLNIQDLGSNRWDVFDPEGRYLGEMSMPERFQPLLFEGDEIYGIQRDEFDVQSVVRYRLNRGATTP